MPRYGGRSTLNAYISYFSNGYINAMAWHGGSHPKMVGAAMNPKNHDEWGYLKTNYSGTGWYYQWNAQLPDLTYRPGKNRFYCTGLGSFQVQNAVNIVAGPTVSKSGATYTANSLGENYIEFTMPDRGGGQVGFNINVMSVPNQTQYMRNFEVIHVDDESIRGTQRWHPHFVSLVRQNNPKAFRTMDWGTPHCIGPLKWEDRSTVTAAPYYAGFRNMESLYYTATSSAYGKIEVTIPGWGDQDYYQFWISWPRSVYKAADPLYISRDNADSWQISINGGAYIDVRGQWGDYFNYDADRPQQNEIVMFTRNKELNNFMANARGTVGSALPVTGGQSVPLEACVELCNLAGVDLWWNIGSSQADCGKDRDIAPYVEQCLLYIDQNLDPDLGRVIEVGNETWNWNQASANYFLQMEGARYPAQKAQNFQCTNKGFSRATSRVGQKMAAVLGSSRSKYNLTIGRQTAGFINAQSERYTSLNYVAENGSDTNLAAWKFANSSCVANYWGGNRLPQKFKAASAQGHQIFRNFHQKTLDFQTGNPALVDAAIEWFLAGFYQQPDGQANNGGTWAESLNWITQSVAQSMVYGLPCICYEGHSHFTPTDPHNADGTLNVFYPTTTLTNPFATVAGSNIVTVTWPNHGKTAYDGTEATSVSGRFAFHKDILLGGLVPTFNGVPAMGGEKNILSVIDANTFTFQFSTTATATATGSGGGSVVVGYNYRSADSKGIQTRPKASTFDDLMIAAKDSQNIAKYARIMLAEMDQVANLSMPAEYAMIAADSIWGDMKDGMWSPISGGFVAFSEYNGSGVIDPGPVLTTFTFSIVP